VSAFKTFQLPVPAKPEPLYTFFPLVSPLKATDQDGYNLGEDNRIKSIFIKDGALHFEVSAILRPGRFLGNHYIAFVVPNRTFIITMDRLKEGIRVARRNKREQERAKKAKRLLEINTESEANSNNVSTYDELSFDDPENEGEKQEVTVTKRPGFFGRFLEGYLEAAREETEAERNERLATAITEFFGSSEEETSDNDYLN